MTSIRGYAVINSCGGLGYPAQSDRVADLLRRSGMRRIVKRQLGFIRQLREDRLADHAKSRSPAPSFL